MVNLISRLGSTENGSTGSNQRLATGIACSTAGALAVAPALAVADVWAWAHTSATTTAPTVQQRICTRRLGLRLPLNYILIWL